MNYPKVSILVPVYGVAPFIEKCARSLFEQTFEDIEYVFVDDCTPDDSIAILKQVLEKYPHRLNQVKIIRHDHNTGIAEVRNTLLDHASGEYTLFVDSDDWVETDMIGLLYKKAIEEDADIVGCDFYTSYKDNEVYMHENYSDDHIINIKSAVSLKISAVLWKLLVKRSVYTSNNICFTKGINVGEDYIICVKLYYYAKKVASISKGLYHYVQYNPNNYSQTSLQNIQDRIKAARQVEIFFIQENKMELIKEELNGRKFIIKTRFLLDDEYEDFDRWTRTFPEADYAWRQFHFRTDYRLIYWLAEHHAFRCLRLVKKLKKLLRR